MMYLALSHGPGYEELLALWHLVHGSYEVLKEAVEESHEEYERRHDE